MIHIAGGTLGFISGAAAVFLRKGSRRHAMAGTVFTISMLLMAASAVYLATVKHQTSNIIGGTFTFYLVGTAWLTARRRENETSVVDWLGMLIALITGTFVLTVGIQKLVGAQVAKDGVPMGMNFFLGTVILLAAAGDIRMLLRHGISGRQRIARHLWRMCFALFVASGSIFLARAHLFPAFMRKSGALVGLTLFPLIALIFWLVRVRWVNGYRRRPTGLENSSAMTAAPN
jgi:hypothetical protein